jgi:protein-ribulosamine 3-kinase
MLVGLSSTIFSFVAVRADFLPPGGTLLGSPVERFSRVSGGDINEAWDIHLTDGRRVFVKSSQNAPPGMFEAEAIGLNFLRAGLGEGAGLILPEVLHVAPQFLVLEYLEQAPAKDGAEALGRGLAQLHSSTAEMFGAPQANFIGTLGQMNETRRRWVDFYREMRLLVQLKLPGAERLLPAGVKRRFEILFQNLEQLLGPEEPPARVHGDLWGGNSFQTARGPAIFDPAAYAGHREVDLAMMQLFGGFSPRTFAAYEETYPLAPGAKERTAIYQLYPLLVHVNLFGAGYVGAVEDALRRVT